MYHVVAPECEPQSDADGLTNAFTVAEPVLEKL